MPRIIVTTDSSQPSPKGEILLDETVQSVHLSSDHAAAQLVQRLAWAIGDAERAEGAQPERSLWPERASAPRTHRPRPRARSRSRSPVAASTGHLRVSSA
jgi:hypothetical protein